MKAKKSLGQNFLIDDNILKKISSEINATEEDLIIEIGPGMGALTKRLKEKRSFLLCYEIDKELKEYLDSLEDDKTKIIYKDILDTDISNDIKKIKYNNIFIVGNLPYYITTPIIKHLVNQKLPFKEMIFMVQNEVAERFCSKPNSKDYGSVTLYLKYYFNISKLFKVSKNSFNPSPKVESAIIKLENRLDKPDVDEEKYLKFINDAFKMKRKTLKNNLSNYNFEHVKKILDKNGLNEKARAEELDEKIFIEIFNNLQ